MMRKKSYKYKGVKRKSQTLKTVNRKYKKSKRLHRKYKKSKRLHRKYKKSKRLHRKYKKSKRLHRKYKKSKRLRGGMEHATGDPSEVPPVPPVPPVPSEVSKDASQHAKNIALLLVTAANFLTPEQPALAAAAPAPLTAPLAAAAAPLTAPLTAPLEAAPVAEAPPPLTKAEILAVGKEFALNFNKLDVESIKDLNPDDLCNSSQFKVLSQTISNKGWVKNGIKIGQWLAKKTLGKQFVEGERAKYIKCIPFNLKTDDEQHTDITEILTQLNSPDVTKESKKDLTDRLKIIKEYYENPNSNEIKENLSKTIDKFIGDNTDVIILQQNLQEENTDWSWGDLFDKIKNVFKPVDDGEVANTAANPMGEEATSTSTETDAVSIANPAATDAVSIANPTAAAAASTTLVEQEATNPSNPTATDAVSIANPTVSIANPTTTDAVSIANSAATAANPAAANSSAAASTTLVEQEATNPTAEPNTVEQEATSTPVEPANPAKVAANSATLVEPVANLAA
jgi:hypothetical protein